MAGGLSPSLTAKESALRLVLWSSDRRGV